MGKGKQKNEVKAPEPKGNGRGQVNEPMLHPEHGETPKTDREAVLTPAEIEALRVHESSQHAAEDAKAIAEAEDHRTLGKYGKAYEAKREDAEGLNVRIVKWERAGQRIVGKFISQEVLPDTKFDTPVQRYVMQTDHGTVSFLLGSATDKELEGKLRAGDLVFIEFQGQTDIGKGRSVNNFTVEKFGHEGE